MFDLTTNYDVMLLGISISSSILFLIKMGMMCLGFDSFESDVDFEADAGDSDTSFKLFSFNVVLAFIMSFGWVTLAAIKEWEINRLFSTLIGVIAGLIISILLAFLLKQVKKLESIREPKKIIKGTIAEVYLRIPKYGIGIININGKQFKATAKEYIRSFDTVEVVEDCTIKDFIRVRKIK